jgi:hypothetical protein
MAHPKFRIGQTVALSKEAIENDTYTDQPWYGKLLTITAVSTKYMPAQQFYAEGRPGGYHPGYDPAVPGMGLYDLKPIDSEEVGSFYDWELRRARDKEKQSGRQEDIKLP